MDEDLLRHWMAADLKDVAVTRMPFGKYGPENYPPRGVPIYDLPAEYLAWFETKAGFPKGRLGQLLKIVYQMKVDGLDEVFDEFRRRAGGRTPLREKKRQGNIHFD